MNFDLSEEQRMWRKAVHDFVDSEVKPLAAELDEQAEFNHAAIAKMGSLGLLGLNIPEDYGGADVDPISAAVALEELGWGCGGTALSVAAHNGLACEPIVRFGTDRQKETWLPTLASGERGLGALALTEPGAGSDLAGGIQTRAVLEEDSWVITGQKAWITNAGMAPVIVTLCRSQPAGRSKLSLILVPGDADGLMVHPKEKKMGTRASPTHGISFEAVRVPRENLLGDPGDGLYQTLQVLDGGRVGVAALAVGLARAAFEEAAAYAQQRMTFGKPLTEHQAVRFMLADAAAQIETSRTMTYRAAWLRGEGRSYTQAAAIAKLIATEAAERICRDAIQIFGAYGYSKEYPVERIYRDARLMTIGEGTSEVQRMVIAKRALETN
ncbi:MAG: acyl-CoA dehydrogenase family protein [Anaerolineales bacterium]